MTRASTPATPATRTRPTASAGSWRSTRSIPTSTPRKHSAMGRFKHEGANVIVAKSGHVVAYMGDDERFDYLYKFVSAGTYRPAAARPQAQHDAALGGRPLRRQVHRQLPGSRDRRLGQAPRRRRLRRRRCLAAPRGGRTVQGGRDVRGRGARLHPPRRRQGGPHQDGPLRRRPAQPAHRQGLRGLHQQRGPRQARQGRGHRGQPPHRSTATATSSKSPRPGTRRPPRSAGTC